MKQVLRKGLKEIVVDEVPEPVLISNHVLVRPVYSLISAGTETASIHTEGVLKEVTENPSHLKKIMNAMRSNGPVRTLSEVRAKFSEYAVLGYSGAGIVSDVGEGVTDVEVGDRVTYGGEGTGHGEVVITGKNLVARIPENVSFEHAAFTTLGSIALSAVRTAEVELGEVVAVIGLGLIGQLTAQLVRSQGGIVVAIDLKSDRVALASQLGADHGILGGDSVREAIESVSKGRGADKVIVAAAAKSSIPCEQALSICRDRGRIIVVGAVELSFPWHEMYLKEIQLFMSRAYGPGSYDPDYERRGQDYPLSYVRWTENRNMEEFLRLLSTRRVEVGSLITHQFPLNEAKSAYDVIMSPASNSLGVLLKYPLAETGAIPEANSRATTKVQLESTVSGKDKVRVGVIGAGNLARWAHLPNLKKMPSVAIEAICSANGARGKSYARRFGASYCSSDFEDLLEDPNIDAVFILTRNQLHARQAEAALSAGKHVFLEKPMAITEEECRRLHRAVVSSGKLLTVGFNRRFAPYYLEQKRQLVRRSSAAVVTCLMNSPGISGNYWMADPSIGGAILGEACHFVDLMFWLLESEPVSVSAFSLPTGQKEPIGQNNLVASFRFADGSIGNLTYCTVGSKTSGTEKVEVFAPGVGVAVEDFKRLTTSSGIRHRRSSWWGEKGYGAQLQNFIGSIQKQSEPQVTVYDGARATICCLKMLESAQTLKPCEINIDEVLNLDQTVNCESE
jgi:predicted dehydrogenase/threonine dehydrogenase-like Zn-dependent dehydrogenase